VKCKNAKTNVEELERLGCIVVHGVNVHSMSIDCRVVGTILYDRIIFNFSHVWFSFGREHESYIISYDFLLYIYIWSLLLFMVF